MPMASELGGRSGPSAGQLFDLVKKRARELRGFSPVAGEILDLLVTGGGLYRLASSGALLNLLSVRGT